MRTNGWMVDDNERTAPGTTARLLLNWQLLQAGFPLTVIQIEEQVRYLGALDQGLSRHSSAGAKAEHAGQRLDLATLVAGAVEHSLDLVAGGK